MTRASVKKARHKIIYYEHCANSVLRKKPFIKIEDVTNLYIPSNGLKTDSRHTKLQKNDAIFFAKMLTVHTKKKMLVAELSIKCSPIIQLKCMALLPKLITVPIAIHFL